MKTDKASLKLKYDNQSKAWMMAKDTGPDEGPGHYPKVKVDYGNQGEFTFVIHNPKGVTFAAKDPFVAKAGKTNPADFADQFSVSGGGTNTLTVKDANANKNGGPYAGGDYQYELHFSNGSTLDPIVSNGGCCMAKSQTNLIYFGLGAVALLALFVLVIRPWLAKR